MAEIWKDIPGYEGLYKISSLGKLKRCNKTYFCGNNTKRVLEEREIIGDKDSFGHVRVTLYKNGTKKRIFLHRLIAESFIPNSENKPEIDHINAIPDDNRVENLRWVTHQENLNNPITLKRKSSAAMGNHMLGKIGKLHHNSKKCLCIETGNVYYGTSEASRKTGLNQICISACCIGKRKTTGGYHWKFI